MFALEYCFKKYFFKILNVKQNAKNKSMNYPAGQVIHYTHTYPVP